LNTFGASYTLDNTPFALHIHAAGSGTHLSHLSVKNGSNEFGPPVVPESAIPDPLWEELVNGLNRAAENPRQIGLERRAGTAAPGRRW
jgi:hypothetical protein